MIKGRRRSRLIGMIASLAVGGSALQLSGCDPQVRSTLLDGLQTTTTSLSDALITAFFLSLADDSTTTTTGGGGLTTTGTSP